MNSKVACISRCLQVNYNRRFRLDFPLRPDCISRPFAPSRRLPLPATMVPKRKKADAILMTPDPSIDENAAADASNTAPRRSGRLQDKASQVPHQESTEYLKIVMQAEPGGAGMKLGLSLGKEEADTALSALQEMEDRLRNDVKRQKMAIEKSKVKDHGLEKEYAALLPRPIQSQPYILPTDEETGGTKKRDVRRKLTTERAGSNSVRGDQENPDTEDTELATAENDTSNMGPGGARPPPVNSDYLPLPWRGRLGYACLNTYLRNSNPPVFSSRTCRIASIIEHRHPLQDPSQPEHPTKNRPDKDQPADIRRGQKYVEALGLANARDIVKMLRWNDKYGIKFMRLSSEMFPFASHAEFGYKLAPFASKVLADAGKVAGELGHRLTTHPGQFTQLGSPRNEVVENAARDLEYHDEMLTLLQLPEQQDKDAVMIIHMGGVFGDKLATLDRFRTNYGKLSDSVKARLVLENDDVSWTVHDLLPVCEELNIPFVLDFHHHNIMFDKDVIREGTKDVMELYPRIKATWDRKGITQKMHYSEPCSEAVTPRQRRKHRPRVMTLPPCPDTMDLMIEAKDKEQAVFDLMRIFRLPGWDTFNDVIPYERGDENRAPPKTPKKKQRKKKGKDDDGATDSVDEPKPLPTVPEAELCMGGAENRVYWPLGMEEWLRPQKREVKNKRKQRGDGEDGEE
ncbi:UV-endonuclease UvdE-domain-containing protein [Nemania sp. FL0916]|nr:UV-endonuclease UvdE-domain-containing protein [Nemania sp. FL0916]